jgi:hypothetical protein
MIKGDYQALGAINTKLNGNQILKSKKTKFEHDEEFEMLYFKVSCEYCENDIGFYDLEKKSYYFDSVVPNYIG